MKKKPEKFDAVKNMRRIRDRISRKIKDMSFKEEKLYLQKKTAHYFPPGNQGADES